jgi:biopolymer transport protein ExbD
MKNETSSHRFPIRKFIGIMLLLLVSFIVIVVIAMPSAYNAGIDEFNKGNYESAKSWFLMVKKKDKEYPDAQLKLKEVNKQLALSHNKPTNTNDNSLTNDELATLISFQKNWADSIVKSWEGKFITGRELYLPDTIHFYLSKAASKNVENTKKHNLGVYEIMYENSKARLPEKLRNYPVVIDFLPAKGYKIENWVKFQTMTYKGVVLYSGQGNEKKIVGIIIGGYNVDGDRVVIVSKPNNETEAIAREDLNRYAYYYMANDPNIGNMLMWQTMKK